MPPCPHKSCGFIAVSALLVDFVSRFVFSISSLWFKKLCVGVSVAMGSNPALLAGRSPLQAVPCAPFAGTSPSAFGSPILPLGASGSEERSLAVLPQGIYKACVAASKLGDLYRKLQSKDPVNQQPRW